MIRLRRYRVKALSAWGVSYGPWRWTAAAARRDEGEARRASPDAWVGVVDRDGHLAFECDHDWSEPLSARVGFETVTARACRRPNCSAVQWP